MAATIVLEPATKTGVISRPYFWKSFASMAIQKGVEAPVRGVYGTVILRGSAALTGEVKKVLDNKTGASNAQMSFILGSSKRRKFKIGLLAAYLFEEAVVEESLRIGVLGLGMIEELQ
jgi:hypothetical protein